MSRIRDSLLVLASLLVILPVIPGQPTGAIPRPEEVIGFPPGTDGRLADYALILRYFQELAASSDRVQLQLVGPTTEGRQMALAVISSPENLSRLETLREGNARLADPRTISRSEADSLITRGKVFVLINESIHSSEVGPAQAGLLTAHFLATTRDVAWQRVLANTVVLLNPCHNPDGYDTVVHWWDEHRENPEHRGAPLPVLYHKYVGHDNNRDWFMFTQVESRVTVKEMHLKWHPQIVVDQHQMGSMGARMFIPPYIEPYEPHVPVLLRQQLEDLGRSVVAAMSQKGLKGVWCNRQFDAWTPARAYMHYHGGVRVLTEVASCRLADPIESAPPSRGDAGRRSPDNPAPWPGGRWGLDDIVRYCQEGALLAVKHASDHRQQWLRNFYTIHRTACEGREGPPAYLIPGDQPRRSALRKLLDIMELGGVEVRRTLEPFLVRGRPCPPGSFLVPNGQPYFAFAQALFENVPYPEIRSGPGGSIRRPYDVTCHNLPLLMNLEVLALPRGPLPDTAEALVGPSSLAESSQVFGDVLLDPRDEGASVDALLLLAEGLPVERVTDAVGDLPPGAFLIRSEGQVKLRHARPQAAPSGLAGTPLRPVRTGIYWSWTANMDEGWTRFFFDSFGLPFTPLRDEDIRAGGLRSRFDLVVLADVGANALREGQRSERLPARYRGGLGGPGLEALRDFVENGGTLVTLNASSDLAIELFDLPLQDPTRGGRGRRSAEAEEGAEEPAPSERRRRPRLNIPGAALLTEADTSHPLGFGASARTPVFWYRGRAFEVKEAAGTVEVKLPVRYAAERLVAGGFAEGAEALAGLGAVAEARIGQGRVVLFAFSPHFRCQTWSTFPLLLNAVLLPAAGP